MHTDREGFVRLLIKHGITVEQYFYLELLYHNDIKSMKLYVNDTHPYDKGMASYLVDLGYIEDLNDPGECRANRFMIKSKIATKLFGKRHDKAIEFWTLYPSHIWIGSSGQRASTKSVDKQAFLAMYEDRIAKQPELHDIIIESLRYNIGMGVQMGIDKWFRSEQWVELQSELNNKMDMNDIVY